MCDWLNKNVKNLDYILKYFSRFVHENLSQGFNENLFPN